MLFPEVIKVINYVCMLLYTAAGRIPLNNSKPPYCLNRALMGGFVVTCSWLCSKGYEISSRLLRKKRHSSRMEMNNSNNCSNLTDKEIEEVALARGITAGICFGILLLVLVVLMILAIWPNSRDRVCGSVKKRLTIWLTAVTVLAELFQSLSFMYYFDSYDVAFCPVNGFLIKYFGFAQLLFTLWMILMFFFEVCEATLKPRCIQKITIDEDSRCCGCKKKVLLEVGLCFVMFIVSHLTAISFISDPHGSIEPWCWCLKENCSKDTVDYNLQIALWNVPYGLVALLTLVFFITALCLLRCTIRRWKLGLINSIVIFVFLVTTFAMCILELTTCVYLKFECHNHDTWLAYAVSTPLGQLAIPLALLVAIHLPLFCKRHKRRKRRRGQRERRNEAATVHDSSNTDVPSNTEWYPPHSEQAELDERTPILHQSQNNANVD